MYRQVISSDLQELFSKIATAENILEFDIKVDGESNKGDGYMGQIIFATIHDKEHGKVKQTVIKKAYTMDTVRSLVPIDKTYMNETNFYLYTWPAFKKFQEECKIEDKFMGIPQYLAHLSKEKCELLILENLKVKGFNVPVKKIGMTAKEVELTFKEFGRFHALSFAYRNQCPNEYASLRKKIFDPWKVIMAQDFFSGAVSGVCKIAGATLLKGKDDNTIKEYQKYVDDVMEVYKKTYIYEGEHSIIIHGDSWSNNMMFTHNEAGEPTELRIIDWQMSRIGTPVYDLSFCLYSSSDKTVFERYDHYLQIYHQSFSVFLKKLGGCHETVFPFEVLKQHWKMFAKYGFIMGLVIHKIRLTSDDEVYDLTDIKDASSQSSASENVFLKGAFDEKAYQENARNLILHMHKIGAL